MRCVGRPESAVCARGCAFMSRMLKGNWRDASLAPRANVTTPRRVPEKPSAKCTPFCPRSKASSLCRPCRMHVLVSEPKSKILGECLREPDRPSVHVEDASSCRFGGRPGDRFHEPGGVASIFAHGLAATFAGPTSSSAFGSAFAVPSILGSAPSATISACCRAAFALILLRDHARERLSRAGGSRSGCRGSSCGCGCGCGPMPDLARAAARKILLSPSLL